MAQYEADKLVRLLQFCCWKARCGMDQKGFQVLAQKIDNLAERGQSTPNERYFSDLLGELNSAVKKDNLIGKRQEFINMVLKFAGVSDWKDWETMLYSADEYVHADELDLSAFSEMQIAICLPEMLEKHVYPDLTFAKRTVAYPVQLLSCKEEEISGQLQFVSARLDEFPIVIWAIPVLWKEQLPLLEDPSWKDLIQRKRVVPVWIDEANSWDTQAPFIPWLKHHQTIGGMPGLLTALLYVQEAIKQYHKPPSDENLSSRFPANVQHFHNHSNGFMAPGNNNNHTLQNIINHNYRD